MRTDPINDKETGSRLIAFRIENAYLGHWAVANILRDIEGVTHVRPRRLFTRPFDVHVRFSYFGCPHVILEPWGDSSDYWIGPVGPDAMGPDLRALEEVFRNYRLPWWRRMFGGFITGKFLASVLRRKRSTPQ